MSIAIARAMVATPRTRSASEPIHDNHQAFVWDDHGEEVEQWNALAGAAAGGADVTVEGEDGELPRFRYKERVVEVPILYERGDNTISVHTLAQLVKADSDIRMCVETCGNSEYAYLPLPPAAWAQLEAEFGREAVAWRFLPLPPDLGEFYAAAESDALMRREYPDDPKPEPDPRSVRLQTLEREAMALLGPAHAEVQLNFYSFPINNSFGLRVIAATDAARQRLRQDSTVLLRLKPLVDAAARDLGFQFRGINFTSQETQRRDHPDDPFHGIFDAGEIPAAWRQAAPPSSAAAAAPAVAIPVPAADPPGAMKVQCPHCGHAFKAVPQVSPLGFRGFSCPACRKRFSRGLQMKVRLACWGLLGVTVWVWAQKGNADGRLLLALLCFAGMVLVDLVQLSRRHGKR